jgi:hypothetical protein
MRGGTCVEHAVFKTYRVSSISEYRECPRMKGQYSRDHSISHSKQKNIRICICVLLRTVSEIQLYYIFARIKEHQDALTVRRATRHVLTRVAKCIGVDGAIFENVLY